ncbi:MAG TPA: metallophosphoesterase family protein [Opitutaceae bacterium]|nr:metallophosphoesterase family protein [Opitutaceae bacterium]
MRIAVISDIHGNLAALDAVLDHIGRSNADQLLVAGDIVNGAPDSLACWERVRGLGCPVLRGNHERYVFDFDTDRAEPEWNTPQFGPLHFAVNQLGRARLKELAALPAKLTLPGVPDFLAVHASARNDHDNIFASTSDAQLKPMFAGTRASVVVRGHNHYCGIREWGDRRIVTAGSVGLSHDGSGMAQFVILERFRGDWKFRHHAVKYDMAVTVRRFDETHYLEQSGPMGRLFMREVATGTAHFVPFLRFYQQTAFTEKVDLEKAIRRFLEDI